MVRRTWEIHNGNGRAIIINIENRENAIDIRYYLEIQLIFMRVRATFVTSENISMKAEAETPWIAF